MNNRSSVAKILALVLVLTLCTLSFASCSFDINSAIPERVERPAQKQLIGAENLTEKEKETIDLINERMEDFYRDIENRNYDAIRMNFSPIMRGALHIIYYGSIIVFEHDALEFFVPSLGKGILGYGFSMLYDECDRVTCVSILISGDTADVIVELDTKYGEIKYHKVQVTYGDDDWFLSFFPVRTDYTPTR